MSAVITPETGSEGTPMESIEPTNLARAAPSSLITDLELKVHPDSDVSRKFVYKMVTLEEDELFYEANRSIGHALFAGIHDELEDLTPDERDQLVQRAFQHEALRAKRPVIWIPRDDLGVSDDEIYRTQRFSKHIWISNEYQALDGKCRPIFSRSLPDFSEVNLIQL
jgi:10TM putative phosphate transporter